MKRGTLARNYRFVLFALYGPIPIKSSVHHRVRVLSHITSDLRATCHLSPSQSSTLMPLPLSEAFWNHFYLG